MIGLQQSENLIINEWEIWHTYTTYLLPTEIDLNSLSTSLVKTGLAHLTMRNNGVTEWKYDGGIGKGISEVLLQSDGNGAKFNFEPTKDNSVKLSGYASEALKQARHFKFSELRIFQESPSIPPDYVRAFLGKLILSSDHFEKCVHLYPILTVYDTGVMSIELRSLSPSSSVNLHEFINDYVNLSSTTFSRVDGPPALSILMNKGHLRSGKKMGFKERRDLLKFENDFERLVKNETKVTNDEEFAFEVSPFRIPEISDSETLSTLSRSIFDAVAFLLSKPKKGLKYIINGHKNLVHFDGYWIGRPHIHLLSFEGQDHSATILEKKWKNELLKIMMRSNEFPSDIRDKYLPKNLRLFDDYLLYLGPGQSLFVWSEDGKKRNSVWEDVNNGHLIYEQQATMRMLDYSYILHRRILNLIDLYKNPQEIIWVQRDLINFEQDLDEVSRYGEIREIFNYGLNKLNIEKIRRQIHESLKLKQLESSYLETKSYKKIGIILSILFGLLSIPTFSN